MRLSTGKVAASVLINVTPLIDVIFVILIFLVSSSEMSRMERLEEVILPMADTANPDQGDEVAQATLGFMYAKGKGVAQDYVVAHLWLNLAAARGNEQVVLYRDLVATNMKPAQIAEAQKLAREWKPMHEPKPKSDGGEN